MRLDEQQFAVHVTTVGMLGEVRHQPLRNRRYGFWPVSDLQRNDTAMPSGRIRSNVRKVTVEGHEKRIQVVGFADHDGIGRIGRQAFPKANHFMSRIAQQFRHAVRHAVIK
jgi:hypothetical protein